MGNNKKPGDKTQSPKAKLICFSHPIPSLLASLKNLQIDGIVTYFITLGVVTDNNYNPDRPFAHLELQNYVRLGFFFSPCLLFSRS